VHLLLLSKTEIDRHLRYKYHYHLAVSVLYNNPSSEIGFDKHVKLEFLIGGWLGGSVGRSVGQSVGRQFHTQIWRCRTPRSTTFNNQGVLYK